MRYGIRSLFLSLAVLAALTFSSLVQPLNAQALDATPAVTGDVAYQPIRTESPRDTFDSFLRVSGELSDTILQYRLDKSIALAKRLGVLSEQALALIDLSQVPAANRRERGNDTLMVLLDIFGRIEAPPLNEIPDVESIATPGSSTLWRIPKSPLMVTLIEDGPRAGEYLFSADTVRSAPRYLRGIETTPLRQPVPFGSWLEMSRHITGPLVPLWLERAMPSALNIHLLDTPAWKSLLTGFLYALVFAIGWLVRRLIRVLESDNPLTRVLLRFTTPLTILALVQIVVPVMALNINLTGRAADLQSQMQTVIVYFTFSWLFWLASRAFFEWLIQSPSIGEKSYDANLLRLVSGIIGIIGIILILAFGGQELGLPVLSLLAGLGVGGLAVALAIRPTLENLISGFTLYIDKPIRVGDFCTFGGQNGTVENIGIRSTQIRALDRTLISIPNAQFADMQLVNWARCDQMLLQETIGVRYETTPDQLRFLLAKLREMLHRHPRIDSPTIRVRFVGYGDSSLNIGIRVYAKTREWNDFFAIQEDVLLRIYDIVVGAGTSFAFPSQTLYLGRDDGLDKEAQAISEKQVTEWRKKGKLPFPRLPEEQQDALADTLDYPPRGSYEAGGEDFDAAAGAERLSAEPSEDEVLEGEQDLKKGN
jgi:MscS family membrane protein